MGEKVNVLARIRSAVVMADNVNDAKDMREVFGIVADLIDTAGVVLSADKWWRNNADSPKSALDRYMDASDYLRAALARIGDV